MHYIYCLNKFNIMIIKHNQLNQHDGLDCLNTHASTITTTPTNTTTSTHTTTSPRQLPQPTQQPQPTQPPQQTCAT